MAPFLFLGGLLAFDFAAQDGGRFVFAKLAGEFGGDFVYGGIEVAISVFGEDVGAGDGKVNFHDVLGFRVTLLVVEKDDVSRNDAVHDFLQMADFIGDVRVNGCSEGEVPWAEMDVHTG